MELVNGWHFKKNNMTYKETLTNIMTEMSKDSNTVFIGQQIVYAGNPMSTTLGNVPKEMMIEVPVMEETQMGMTLGLSMLGKKVVTFYPRWDFIISAANQLINHIDKYELMTEQKPHIIVRVGKGSDTPLDPGHQHKANYIEEFKSMCKTIKIFDCKSPKEIEEAYHFANNNKGVYIINEYPEKYNDYGVLNIICDESSDYSNTNKIQNIFGDGWYEITNYEICDRSQISLRKNENFYHIIVINTYISSVYIENPILPVSEEIKQLMRENKNLYTIFLTEHECETGVVIDVIDYGIKNENLDTKQFFIINGNEKLSELKNKIGSEINVHTTNRLHVVVSKNMCTFGYDYQFKGDKENLFMCHNRMLKSHRFSMLCMLKKYGLLEETDWSLLKGFQMESFRTSDGVVPGWMVGNVLFDDDIKNLNEEIQYFGNIDVRKSKYEQDYDVDIGEWGFDWNKTFEMNHHSNSYINIVGESQFEFEDVVHITEKSIIPFHYSQFPIIAATHEHVKTMKGVFGFDFFDDLIDHSYDDEKDVKKRFKMIFNEILRLHKNKDEVIKFYKESRHRFKNNKEKVLEITKDKTDTVFFKNLINKKH